MIPKKFHQIWLGGKPLPEEFRRYRNTWMDLHPEWSYQLWTEKNLFRLENQAEFDASQWVAQKADIARYEIIFRHGGVYIDTDFEALRSIDPLLRGVEAFSARENERTVAIGIFGSERGHSAIAKIIRDLPFRFNVRQSPNETTGPSLMTSVFEDREDVTIFGPELFYPIPFGSTTGDLSKAYAVHHWAHSWK